ncbi:hypothetical protein AQZ49_01585 [Novosphingobium sp. FSW06-99]|nr:hypothetical protein AQZ49_01585 [Novosphingobium sp. FSW06-99]
MGTPGATWPQQLYAAGLISAPTVDAAAAYMVAGWQVVTESMTAVSGQLLSVDTTAGPVTITLPAGGGIVSLRDNAGTWVTNHVTVEGNGPLIVGSAAFTLDITGYRFDFNEVGGVWRWQMTFLYGSVS